MASDGVPLSDAGARRAIREDIGVNLAVEAAAGTGKTTCLVERLLTLARSGGLSGRERLAAVTFTRKAAAELRERLERRLESALRDAPPGRDRENLAAAVANLPECHIGTIHSFCARLLRERPVESGVGLAFSELERDGDELLREQAWGEFSARLNGGAFPDLYGAFFRFGLSADGLSAEFSRFAEYPDIGEWPGGGPEPSASDAERFLAGCREFAASLGRFRPALDGADPGRDRLLPVYQTLDGRLARLAGTDPAGLAGLCRLLPENPGIVQGNWKPLGLDGGQAKEERERYLAFRAETVKPFETAWLAAAYAAVLRAFSLAREGYDRLRRERQALNFQDLLSATARLLREYPEVRREFAGRYARLLVDEVQDTDPIQAEIMFLLASDDIGGGDWRSLRPRPGALFVVGDPKQSIYRFRRADIACYQDVKRRIGETGGRTVELATNFRSGPDIVEWINRTFLPGSAAGKGESSPFPATETVFSPAYVPFVSGSPPPPDSCFHGVFRLETIKAAGKDGVGQREVFRDEASRIAGFIRRAVDARLPLPDGGEGRPARYGDFLIVTRFKPRAVYAEELRRLGIPCRVAGGGVADSPGLRLLSDCLRALANPDDPVLVAAVLRGGLFGVSDAELYRWKRAGGTFGLAGRDAPLPGSPVASALGLLGKYAGWLDGREPVRALLDIASDLGLWALSCAGGDPEASVSAFASGLEILKSERAALHTPGRLAERLGEIFRDREGEDVPPREEAGAVRIMHLHTVKGLEAPVVFLASTYRSNASHPVRFAVDRSEGAGRGYMAVRGGVRQERRLAEPFCWDLASSREEEFLEAEATRLRYVAVTRAGAALIVSCHKADGKLRSSFLPEVDIADALPEPDAVAGEGASFVPPDPERRRGMAGRRAVFRERILAETYGLARAKGEGGWLMPARRGGGNDDGPELSGEEAALFGEVLHRLLAAPPAVPELRNRASGLLEELGLPGELEDAAVDMALRAGESGIWRRSLAAEKVFREAPFTHVVRDGGRDVVHRGVIDLVFREGGGWVVVEYKSDRVGGDLEGAAERHAGQLSAYAGAWERATGEKVFEKGVYFLRAGAYVVLQ